MRIVTNIINIAGSGLHNKVPKSSGGVGVVFKMEHTEMCHL